jgi:hypothetical protein
MPVHGVFGAAVGFQPLGLKRRLVFGVHTTMDLDKDWEFNGFMGYQHYFGYVAPYVTALAGTWARSKDDIRFNLGGEAGIKLYPGNTVFHFNMSVGSSFASPLHGSLGIGLDLGEKTVWQVLLFPLYFCR